MGKFNRIYYIMGVSGCGKSTVGSLLAEKLNLRFFDGDDFHSDKNVKKMASGAPLNDEDRMEWLEKLNALALENLPEGAIIGCSALKSSYRNLLSKNIENRIVWVYLRGTYEEIWSRMEKRKDHFMPSALLKSQFKTLEPPKKALVITINQTPEEMVSELLLKISL